MHCGHITPPSTENHNAQIFIVRKITIRHGKLAMYQATEKAKNVEIVYNDSPQSLQKVANLPEIIIDEQLSSLVPPLKEEEYKLLEASILKEGCRDAIVVWKQEIDGTVELILLDGKYRLKICAVHNIPYNIVEIEVPDREAAILWVINGQLARRNLLPEQVSYLRGKRYNLEKTVGHGAKSGGHFVTQIKTAERLGAEYKTTSRTIKRDGKYASSLDAIAMVAGVEQVQKILSRIVRINKEDVKKLGKLALTHPEELVQALTEKTDGKDLVKVLKERLRRKMSEPFPYSYR